MKYIEVTLALVLILLLGSPVTFAIAGLLLLIWYFKRKNHANEKYPSQPDF